MTLPNTILDELHAIRDALANASDQDLEKIAEAARLRQKDSGHEIVRLSPKLVVSEKKAS